MAELLAEQAKERRRHEAAEINEAKTGDVLAEANFPHRLGDDFPPADLHALARG